MKYQDFFSSKDRSKKLKCCLLQFLFGALRAKYSFSLYWPTDLADRVRSSLEVKSSQP